MIDLLTPVALHMRELHELRGTAGVGVPVTAREMARMSGPARIILPLRQVMAWLGVVLPRRPGVSVITPTWERNGLLMDRCRPSVQRQTYSGEIEHIVVSDGPDLGLAARLPNLVMLPEHRPAINRGLAARRYGTLLAAHPVIAYLDDDNAWRPRHLDRLVSALLESGSDFAFSRALCHRGDVAWTIGTGRPELAQIDTSLIVHRTELLSAAGWQFAHRPADWDLVDRWLAAGAQWVFVPEITLDYYVREQIPSTLS